MSDPAPQPAPSASEPLIRLRGGRLGYRRGDAILDGVDLDVAPGEFLGIVGPNGSGKTTVLRAILGIIPLLEGETVTLRLARGEGRLDVEATLVKRPPDL